MKKRIITAVILVPALLLILFVAPKWATAVLFGLISGLAALELLYGTGMVRHVRLVAYSVLAAFLVPLWCHFGMNPVWGRAGLLLFFLLLFMEELLSSVGAEKYELADAEKGVYERRLKKDGKEIVFLFNNGKSAKTVSLKEKVLAFGGFGTAENGEWTVLPASMAYAVLEK